MIAQIIMHSRNSWPWCCEYGKLFSAREMNAAKLENNFIVKNNRIIDRILNQSRIDKSELVSLNQEGENWYLVNTAVIIRQMFLNDDMFWCSMQAIF